MVFAQDGLWEVNCRRNEDHSTGVFFCGKPVLLSDTRNFPDGAHSMASLSELVRQDYETELDIIKKTGGSLWLRGIGAAFVFLVVWGIDWVSNRPWSNWE